jgi:hypothetical protein
MSAEEPQAAKIGTATPAAVSVLALQSIARAWLARGVLRRAVAAARVLQRWFRRRAVARAARGARGVANAVRRHVAARDREALTAELSRVGSQVLAGIVPGAVRAATREHVDSGNAA